jgi:deoxyribonuclease-4
MSHPIVPDPVERPAPDDEGRASGATLPRIGAHLSTRSGLPWVAQRAHELGASAVQVFTDDPKAWSPRTEPRPDDGSRGLLEALGIEVLVHASYLVNLASPDPEIHARSIERVRHELAAAALLGASVVTTHVGSHRGSGVSAGIERTGDALARILGEGSALDGLDAPVPRLALEVSAGQGDGLGVTVEELGAILDAAERRGVGRDELGVCLDTAHLWATGHRLDEPDAIDELVTQIDLVLGPSAVALLHLNDSRTARGARQDRHEHLGEGRIGERGLGHLVRHPRLARLPMVLETPGMEDGWDAINVARAHALARGEPMVAGMSPAPPSVRAEGTGGARTHIPGTTPEPA